MFDMAKPVWLKGREKEMHLRVEFKAVVDAHSGTQYRIRLATSGIYHLFVNGTFVSYGPARAGRGHFRMDELDVSRLMTKGENVVVIEVCGYNVNSYCMLNQPSFLQAEVLEDGRPIAWTGEHFTARVNPYYIQRTQRYSFQRPMVEAYRYPAPADDFARCAKPAGTQPVVPVEEKTIIPRLAPYPLYERLEGEPLFSGTVSHIEPASYKRDRSCTDIGPQLLGFPIPELEVFATDECQRMRFTPGTQAPSLAIPADGYTVCRFPHNATGMVTLEVECPGPMTLYLLFDEILTDNQVDFLRMDCANAIRFDLGGGVHRLQLFEVYTMKYVQLTAIGGPCEVRQMGMVEYKHPPVSRQVAAPTPGLRKIAEAAVETFRQNAVDIFMDCPSRERAGWLCDSFFTGRTEYCLTGESVIEKSFLENFLHEDSYEYLPEGMLPMCYPADHNDHWFLPNWTLWLILQLEEYRQRTGDRELIERFQEKFERLLRYFGQYENEDGLLEHLDGWGFVEWSKANDLVQDVNYPTNMLYSAALRTLSRLYDRPDLAEKADRIKATVLAQSFNGRFFVDNAVRRDGRLVSSGECTEVCQYYAFFCGIASPETHGELFQTLVEDFGPDRKKTGKWPEVYPAAPFIGNYLRLDVLQRYGYRDKVLENIEGYFLHMAETTGTLWEHAEVTASCDHCFASHVLYWLDQIEKATAQEAQK